jgi:hypothetical protein
MPLRSVLVTMAAVIACTAAALGEDLAGTNRPGVRTNAVAKPHPNAKPKHVMGDSAAQGSMDEIQFSQPNASPLGSQKTSSPSPGPKSGVAPSEPQGGVSLDLHWRASNDRVDPYDAVRHSSGPDGPGDAVEGGIKLGF